LNPTTVFSILWRRLDRPGHEAARLVEEPGAWRLEGSAVFLHANLPCRLDYQIVCSAGWETRTANVNGWLGTGTVSIEITAYPSGEWLLNGKKQPQVRGCLDLDLNFSPITNLLPVRRLKLVDEQTGQVRAAWLRFPDFDLQPLEQTYTRHSASHYTYTSAGRAFVAELGLDANGLVRDYPGYWRAEPSY
jgi:hypothetical protein